ncbi:hypothetical protein LTR62_004826 [Meristemomyces frigidus]|uniref:Uncharacterized protein n=1 Tax=Meristemomyces frigidus TaxID=1508187 RepID=A0AAN7YNU9_9PEZI|nr:hypothetical protein LTR62_004826 [Meristemomyces frigidus]
MASIGPSIKPLDTKPNRDLTATHFENLTLRFITACHDIQDPTNLLLIRRHCAPVVQTEGQNPGEFVPNASALSGEDYISHLQNYKARYPTWSVEIDTSTADLDAAGRAAVVWAVLVANESEKAEKVVSRRETMYRMFWRWKGTKAEGTWAWWRCEPIDGAPGRLWWD